ncbi:hypothetical protein KEM52_004585 [Ascosphaera acerosa]|nr:hypothetical protein KEM52_004585 [Ascosphaera acerosa]
MSSGFVSGGTISEPVERDQAWHDAQKAIEDARAQKEAEAEHPNAGKSLYEILQENKAAKQEAFEESIKLKNQFRTLDEDEIEFLDSVMESTRAEEAARKKETMEQLELFHRQREEAAKAEAAGHVPAQDLISPEETKWDSTLHRKRRRKGREPLLSAKLRKRSSPSAEEHSPLGKAGEAGPVGEPPDGGENAPATASALQTKAGPPKQSQGGSQDRQKLPADDQQKEETEEAAAASVAPASKPQTAQTAKTAQTAQPALVLGLDAYDTDEDDD